MKKRLSRTLALMALIGSFLLLVPVAAKTVIPPDTASGSQMSGGKDINYPKADGGYTEDSLPLEGTLDDSNAFGEAGSGSSADQQSDEYKRTHGRCSANLSPIYFDFDQAGVRPGMTDVLVGNADYLNTIPGTMVIIEGNSDERGTNEYNLAWEREEHSTPNNISLTLVLRQTECEPCPMAKKDPLLNQDEDAYSMNRRVDFVVQ